MFAPYLFWDIDNFQQTDFKSQYGSLETPHTVEHLHL